MVNFGRVIKSQRAKQGLTQKALAYKARITVPYLSKLENDRKEPSLPLLKKLCRLLHLPEEVLFWEAVEFSRTFSQKDRKIIEVAKHIVHRYVEA